MFAKSNIHKYKYNYVVFLVIIDELRSQEVLVSNSFKKMRDQYKYLINKYAVELKIIIENDENKIILTNSLNRISKDDLFVLLKYVVDRLPVIGFIKLGLEEQVGISIKHETCQNIIQ